MTTYLRNPRQAQTIFDLGGPQPPRPKGLFVVRFRKAEHGQGTNYWQRDLGFLVKSIEQPTISPKTEEIKQYNRTRQIYTGYSTQPINCVLFDTADGMALRMWNDYVRYYFADFSQSDSNYNYDVVDRGEEMLGNDIGYGFKPQMDQGDAMDENSQFFFTGIDIYQVFRNAYTKTTLVNPRISTFTPDDLDYEQMGPVTYRMSFAYEAVLYENQGAPVPIDADAELADLFSDIRLHGDVIEVSGPEPGMLPSTRPEIGGTGGSGFGVGGGLGGLAGAAAGLLGAGLGLSAPKGSGVGGVLNSFGKFDFGAAAGVAVKAAITGNKSNIASELVFSATGNAQLATVINMATTKQSAASIAGQILNGVQRSGYGNISPALYDAGYAAVAAAGGNKLGAGTYAAQAVQGILGGALVTGTSPTDQVSKQGGGLSLSQHALAFINSSGKSLISQIGFRKP